MADLAKLVDELSSLTVLEAAEYVVEKCILLGYQANLSKNRLIPQGLNIVFGAHISPSDDFKFPPNTIIFNTEQLPEINNSWINPAYKKVLDSNIVWDYSAVNLKCLAHQKKFLVNFYHVDKLNRLNANQEPEFDLIFYGSVNERRKTILDNLNRAGLRVLTIFSLYGPERDDLLIRSRAVLNLHYYDAQIFQQIRSFYPLSNGIPVVSENYPLDSAPAIYQKVLFTPGTSSFESYVRQLFNDPVEFRKQADLKIGLFRATLTNIEFADVLKKSLELVSSQFSFGKKKDTLPTKINLGSVKNYRADCLNIDIEARLMPDVVLDLSEVDSFPITVPGLHQQEIVLNENQFDEITALDVLEHVPKLTKMMENCLKILKEGGKFNIVVPYDLSLGAWQDPTHIRAFNENSWLYYTDWFWYLGWFDYRFERTELTLNLSALGEQLHKQNIPQEQLILTPRTIDSMKVVLVKRRTTPEEKTLARAFSNDFGV